MEIELDILEKIESGNISISQKRKLNENVHLNQKRNKENSEIVPPININK